MALSCQICGKGSLSGFSVSHSHRKTKRRWKPNLQKTTVLIGDSSVKVKACTKCIKTLNKDLK
jgi:large subunit ribosomal protein L28